MYTTDTPRTTVAPPARTGPLLVIVGSLAVLGFRLAHGDLPAADAAAAVHFIGDHPPYPAVHLGDIAGVLTWAAGYLLITRTLAHPTGGQLGMLGGASLLVGAAVFIVEHSIDGIAGHDLAAAWATATPAARADLVLVARTAFTMLRGPSLTAIIVLWGIPLVLLSVAFARERYPRWLTWTGALTGGTVIVAATALALRPDLFPGAIVYGALASVAVQLWNVAAGVVCWRAASAATTTAARAA
jgi:hypothetical protein